MTIEERKNLWRYEILLLSLLIEYGFLKDEGLLPNIDNWAVKVYGVYVEEALKGIKFLKPVQVV